MSRRLTGTFQRALLVNERTQEPLDVFGKVTDVLDEPTYRRVGTGRQRPVARRRALAVVCSEGAQVQTLRRWVADGDEIRAIVVGRTAHWQWEEPIQPLMQAEPRIDWGLAGHRITLDTTHFHAPIFFDDNLLAPLGWDEVEDDNDQLADGYKLHAEGAPVVTWDRRTRVQTFTVGAGERVAFYGDRVLPAPGLAVYLSVTFPGGGTDGLELLDDPTDTAAIRLRLQALGREEAGRAFAHAAALAEATEEVLTSGTYEVALTLPAGTYAVRAAVEIEGGTAGLDEVGVEQPLLRTRTLGEAALVGGYLMTAEDPDSVTITDYGDAELTETTRTVTFGGVDYTVEIAALGPTALLDRIAEHGDPQAAPYALLLYVVAI